MRILVRPDELARLSGELRRVSGQLREVAARLGSEVSSLEWMTGQKLDVEGQVSVLRQLAERLATDADQMAQFLTVRADLFRTADGRGLEELGRLASTFATASRQWLETRLRALEGLNEAQWIKWGTAAATGAAAAVPFIPGGLGQRFPEQYGRTGVRDGTGATNAPARATPLPGPFSTRLPNAQEIAFIQRVFGISENGYGPRTRGAIRNLQRQYGISVDNQAMIGPRTWNALMNEEKAGTAERLVPPPPGPARSEEELARKFEEIGQPQMKRWAPLIWSVAQDVGISPEILAAQVLQESGGNPNADAGEVAGKGLLQIEFSAHYGKIEGKTTEEKLAWIREPKNNLSFGAKLLREVVNESVGAHGPEEGLKRAFQYWNYGPGAARWVEQNSKSPDDWQHLVDQYHDTHLYAGNGKWVDVPTGGNYGNPNHWKAVYGYYSELMDTPAGVEVTDSMVAMDQGQVAASSEILFAPEVAVLNAAAPVTAPIQVSVANRSQALYNTVIDQFAVEQNPRYMQRDSNGDGYKDTFCNIYAWDVTRAMGAEVPHWVLPDGLPASGTLGHELNASATSRWLADYGTTHGWREVSAEEAQNQANLGRPAVAAYDGGQVEPGHLAVVRPGVWDAETGPAISQAGGLNSSKLTVREGFGSTRIAAVKYYVHD